MGHPRFHTLGLPKIGPFQERFIHATGFYDAVTSHATGQAKDKVRLTCRVCRGILCGTANRRTFGTRIFYTGFIVEKRSW